MFARTKGRVHFNIRFIFLSTNNECHVTEYLRCRGKTKVSYYIFARKTKVSYYITFFLTLLKTFSCDHCYSYRRIILSYCEKRKVNYDVCKKNIKGKYIILSMSNSHVTNIYTVEEKQKYHITFFCKKNKSIILHHVLPNSPENVFLLAFVMMKSKQQRTNCQTKYKTIFQVKEKNRRFIWLPLECFTTHARKCF